jgi:hypothetical protein
MGSQKDFRLAYIVAGAAIASYLLLTLLSRQLGGASLLLATELFWIFTCLAALGVLASGFMLIAKRAAIYLVPLCLSLAMLWRIAQLVS